MATSDANPPGHPKISATSGAASFGYHSFHFGDDGKILSAVDPLGTRVTFIDGFAPEQLDAQGCPPGTANPLHTFLRWFEAQPADVRWGLALFVDPFLICSQEASDFDYDALEGVFRSWLERSRNNRQTLCAAYLLHQLVDRLCMAHLSEHVFMSTPEEKNQCVVSWQRMRCGAFSLEQIDGWFLRQSALAEGLSSYLTFAPVASESAPEPAAQPQLLAGTSAIGKSSASKALLLQSTGKAPVPKPAPEPEWWVFIKEEIIAKYPAIGIGNSRENLAFIRAFMEMGGTPDAAMGVAELVMLYPLKN